MNIVQRNKIVTENMNLVYLVANQYKKYDMEYEDVVSCGFEGLIKCVDKYDDSKAKFSSFAIKCIQNEINTALKKEIKNKSDLSLDKETCENKSNIDYFVKSDIENTPEEIYLKKEKRNDILKLISELKEVEQEIIKLRYGFYDNIIYLQGDIAKKYGFTQSYACRYEQRILKKLKNKIK